MTTKRPSKQKQCVYLGCPYNSNSNPEKMFYLFPKNSIEAWINACKNPSLRNFTLSTLTHGKYVCNDHFEDNQFAYQKDPFKKKLKPGAIPGNYVFHVFGKTLEFLGSTLSLFFSLSFFLTLSFSLFLNLSLSFFLSLSLSLSLFLIFLSLSFCLFVLYHLLLLSDV